MITSTSSLTAAESMNPLLNCGLTLWPSTFVPLTNAEVQAHALRHPRILLACKNALKSHALDLGITGSGGKRDDDKEN